MWDMEKSVLYLLVVCCIMWVYKCSLVCFMKGLESVMWDMMLYLLVVVLCGFRSALTWHGGV